MDFTDCNGILHICIGLCILITKLVSAGEYRVQ